MGRYSLGSGCFSNGVNRIQSGAPKSSRKKSEREVKEHCCLSLDREIEGGKQASLGAKPQAGMAHLG